jgi:hypothetical protein
MVRRLSNRSRIEQLTDKFEPEIRAAFLAAIRDIADKAELGKIAERLERGDIAGALEAVHLDAAAYHQLQESIRAAFNGGGLSTVGALPLLRDPAGGRFVIRWNGRNLRAERWLREHSSDLITRTLADQRTAIREALTAGMQAGRNPNSTALDIIGRVNRATGRREGGLVGLTSPQAGAVAKARSELLSGDSGALRSYLARTRRDKRFDRVVAKAIADEAPVDAATVSKMIGRYSDSLLQLRGETIARTETMAALNQSGIEAMQQAVDAGAVDVGTITKVWHTAQDQKVRDSHAELEGEAVDIDGVFANGLAYPGDPSGPPEEIANCRCWMETRIDFLAGLQ